MAALTAARRGTALLAGRTALTAARRGTALLAGTAAAMLVISGPAFADTFAAHTATAKPRVTTATLYGYVDTAGQQTRFSFQYGATSSYGSSSQSGILPSGQSGPVLVEAQVGHLTPGTSYHFRLVAEPITSSGSGAQADGADATFRTEREHLQLDRSVMRVFRKQVAVRLSCESSSTCNGVLTLTTAPTAGKKQGPTCASSVVSVDSWATTDTAVTLSASCLKLLRSAPLHRLHAIVQVAVTSGQQGLERHVLLTSGPRARRRRAPARRAA